MQGKWAVLARRCAVVGALAAVAAAGGCIGVGGSDRTYVHRPTVGQELTDLKHARDAGAIDDAEYGRLKAELMNRHVAHGGGGH